MVDKSVLMICRSIDNLAKEVRDLKRILLRKSDLAIDEKKMEGLEDDGLEDDLKCPPGSRYRPCQNLLAWV